MRYVTDSPIDLSALGAVVAAPERGGTAMFVGTVRAGPEDGPVREIVYSAYEEMLEAEFGRIVEEVEAGVPGLAIAAIHRIGPVPVGQASIAVVAAAPHRAEAFEGCRRVIEAAKRRLPVWKREVRTDGSAAWRENREWASPSS